MDGLIEVPEESWLRGGTPDESRVVPWSVQSISRGGIDFWQGTLAEEIIDNASSALVDELR